MQSIETIPGKWYAVTSASGCSVTLEDGTLVKECEAPQDFFNAPSGKALVSDDAAIVRETFNSAPVAGGGGGGAATGEKFGNMIYTGSDDDVIGGTGGDGIKAILHVEHATWFDNLSDAGEVTVYPKTWKNEVMTCYLKTAVPVELSGVQWLYGEPAMVQGFTYVVALQQIDASTVLANLAYTLKQ